MALTQEEQQMYKNWCDKFTKNINSNDTNVKKKCLMELDIIIRKDDFVCCENNIYGQNYYQNSYCSNNVQIIGNNTNNGSVCNLF